MTPIDVEVLRNAMSSIADEMYIALMKSAYSTNIKERRDHSTALFDADGTWKNPDALARAFADAGVDLDRPIVTSCGSGVTAAVLTFALHLLGRRSALYDGSWTEWGNLVGAPIETEA